MRFGVYIALMLLGGLVHLAKVRAADGLPTFPAAVPEESPATVSATASNFEESPVFYFRRMLALSEIDREKQLAAKPEWQRKILREKLVEYSLFPAEKRDAQLQVLQLRFYLLPLMKLPPAARSNAFARVAAEWQPVVKQRLDEWDILPAALQAEVLESEMAKQYFVRLGASSPAERKAILDRFPADKRQAMERELNQWLSVPPDKRKKIFSRLDHYLEMTPEERARVWDGISDVEQQQMQLTLNAFQNLSKDQRAQCLASFQKLAEMSDSERVLFLANVERWKEMAAEERQKWRDLVGKLPPMPPGFEPVPVPELPPLPPQ